MKNFGFLAVIVLMPLAGAQAVEDISDEHLHYNRDVLPILAENCFTCHGFDKAARETDLRLDLRESAITSSDGVSAIVPDAPESSELIRRITATDPDEIMPPSDSGHQLTGAQRETLRLWIAQGAEYEPHWSFILPIRAEPPSIPETTHPIDRFIQSRLATAKLQPSPAASSAVLIRRVSLDLTGLPPTLEEVDAFESAIEKAEQGHNEDEVWLDLVDRLLGSPHYGERWGRWWFDQARYADSNGYSVDSPRSIWKYRDWVIDALNADMPFDQFTLEQLAGDLLPEASVSQQVATGFHRNTQINQEGGIDKEQFHIDSEFDRVATTGSVWLGQTIGTR